MNPAVLVGQILLWCGFLSGSLATVFSLEVDLDKWSTINWTWYLISFGICAGGIVFLRIGKGVQSAEMETSRTSYAALPKYLQTVLTALQELQKKQHELPPSKIVEFIDDRCADGLRDFAEEREAIISQRGLQDYAEIMTQFAAGERSINRAWSAAADGYLDETETYLARAETFLRRAVELLMIVPDSETVSPGE